MNHAPIAWVRRQFHAMRGGGPFLFCLLLVGCPEPVFESSDALVVTDGSATDAEALDQGAAIPDASDQDADLNAPDADLNAPDMFAAADMGPNPDAAISRPRIEGRWLSEGADIAPLLANAPASLRRLEAYFAPDGRFTVEVLNDQAQRFSLTGTFSVNEDTDPSTISLQQVSPEAAVSHGIWSVSGDVLTYEVSQTEPPIAGVAPPTVQGGFGSTSGGNFDDDNIQTYRRVR